jgi:hypothetical protein
MSMDDGTAADRPNWWDRSSYDYTAQLTRQGWAWEFLRRNPVFRQALAQGLEGAEWLRHRGSLDIFASRVDLARWDVLFREFAEAWCGRLLVSAPVPARLASGCGTGVRIVSHLAV